MKGLIQSAVLCLIVSASLTAAPSSKEVYRISITERADRQGYVVRLHSRGRIRSADITVRQDDLQYAEILLAGAVLSAALERGDAAGPVRAYSVEPTDGGIRVRLSLDPDRPVRIVAYPDDDSDDALIALTYAHVTPRPVREGATSPPDPATANTEVSGKEWTLDCVVIDAGHGGKDPGAVANGVREKDVNLAVAKKLGFYLEDRLGLRVVYTRSDDRFVPLEERGRIANDECGKLFISLHANSARRQSASGTEIYFLGLHKTDAAHSVMERENSVIRLENNPEQYLDLSSEQAILATMAQSIYLRESEHLADVLHQQFRDRAMRTTRGVKQAGFLVLWKASMPAILVELGFVTNKEEARYLKSSKGHDLLASAIFRAVRSYREAYQRGSH